MLSDYEAIAMIAVKDLIKAAEFYERTLGLARLSTEGEEAITYRCGNSRLNVYRSQFASTNKATSVVWNVGNDIEALAGKLKSKGISFQQYDMPGMTRNGDIYQCGNMQVAWFKDPDGNILSITSDRSQQ